MEPILTHHLSRKERGSQLSTNSTAYCVSVAFISCLRNGVVSHTAAFSRISAKLEYIYVATAITGCISPLKPSVSFGPHSVSFCDRPNQPEVSMASTFFPTALYASIVLLAAFAYHVGFGNPPTPLPDEERAKGADDFPWLVNPVRRSAAYRG
jgi:hypothetical protein